jgi:hypothetical protein
MTATTDRIRSCDAAAMPPPSARTHAGWAVIDAASQRPAGTHEETTSMLDQPLAGTAPATIEPRARRRTDHAMDVLQYGIALLAIAVVVLLASFR